MVKDPLLVVVPWTVFIAVPGALIWVNTSIQKKQQQKN